MEWQPIDTMPKSGRVLLFAPTDDITLRYRVSDADLARLLSEATHWMTLPEPPEG
jgi:hypothetical protein